MKTKVRRWPVAIDLFCGCGAVTAGLKSRHFRVAVAVDNDPIACKTYKQNHPNVCLFQQNIKEIDPVRIRRKILNGKDLDLLVVCAPCQPFSRQNRQSTKDGRTNLILEAVRFARILKPKVILFENVPGLKRPRFAPLIKKLGKALRMIGYVLGDTEEVDAADYGVPQRRLRCIMLARKNKKPPGLPPPTTPTGKRMTVAEAVGGLRKLKSGEADRHDILHFARHHRPIVLKRLAYTPKNGGGRDSLPSHLELQCHKGHRGHPDVYGRMRWDDVAPTLTTGCTDVTRGRFAHPEDDRAITLREAARLQTFPDYYHFSGDAGAIATQVGNAVPIRLIEELAPTLRAAIRS